MTDITEFPNLDGLENRFIGAFSRGKQLALSETPDLSDEINAIELDEVIIVGAWANDNATEGQTNLSVVFMLHVPDEELPGDETNPANVDEFREAAEAIQEGTGRAGIDWPLFDQWFQSVSLGTRWTAVRDESLTILLNRIGSQRFYSLTRDNHIRLDEEGNLEEVSLAEKEEVSSIGKDDIINYPELEDLRDAVVIATEEAVFESDDINEEQLDISTIIVNPPWGNGIADEDDFLELIVYFDIEGFVQPRNLQGLGGEINFNTGEASGPVGELFESTDLMKEWFPGINFSTQNATNLDLSRVVTLAENQRLFDLFTLEIIRRDDEEIIRDDIEEIETQVETEEIEEDVAPEPEPAITPVEQPEPAITRVPEEAEEVEVEIPIFPDVPEEIREFAISPDTLEVPAGKETKRVEVREIYDFEKELARPDGNLPGGIGEAMEDGEFGFGESPGTYPRTGNYIKHYLDNRGPAYVLQMYNDLVIYSAFISTIYTGTFRAGTYASFRALINRLRLVGERTGTRLIVELAEDEVADLELDVTPDHPSDVLESAPWLENRNYYDIIEENMDHQAWDNVVGFLDALETVE